MGPAYDRVDLVVYGLAAGSAYRLDAQGWDGAATTGATGSAHWTAPLAASYRIWRQA